MNKVSCEKVLMAKMTQIDGEEAELSQEQISKHIAGCEGCHQEIEKMQIMDGFLRRQTRREYEVDLRSVIEEQINKPHKSEISRKPFLWLSINLVIYKSLEMLPEPDFGLVFRLIPLILIISLFVFIKENPFKINTELALER